MHRFDGVDFVLKEDFPAFDIFAYALHRGNEMKISIRSVML